MSRALLLATVALFIALLSGCGGVQPGPQDLGAQAVTAATDGSTATPAAKYMPLKVGNKWTYRFRPYQVPPSTHYTDQVWTVERTDLHSNGVLWYHLKHANVGGSVTYHVRHDALGFIQLTGGGSNYYEIKAPLRAGHRWTSPGDLENLRIVATTATTQAFGRTYKNCLVVTTSTTREPDKVEKRWYAPNTGMVRYEYRHNGNLVQTGELMKFTPAH